MNNAEIDEKVKKILSIVENGDNEEDESKTVIAELVKEIYREYESLYTRYDDLTGEIKKKVDGKGENESSSSSSSDSDSDKKNKRKVSVKKQIEAANLEIADLKRNLATTLEEKEAVDSEYKEILKKLKISEEIIGDLRIENNKLASENKELNETNSDMIQKIEDMKKERDGLNAELENKFQEVSDYVNQISHLRDEMANKAKDHEHILEQNNRLQNETEAELEREKQEKPVLLNQINDLQKALLEKEVAYDILSQENEKIKDLFEEREATIKKLTNDYKQSGEIMEEKMNRLRNEVEMKVEEIESLLEKMSNIEVKLRLSNQKLRITEQALIEKEDDFKSIEAKHLEKQEFLEEKIETYRGMIKEIAERVNSTLLNQFQTLSEKLEEKHGSYEETVVEATKMILKAKKSVIEIKKEKEEMEKKFEEKVREKEKLKETLLELGEEKREAIRQLCVWIDHHRDRSEYLEEVLSKMVAGRGQRRG